VEESFGSFFCGRMNCSPLPFDWLRRRSTRQKMKMFIFRRSRIEAESKSNAIGKGCV